MDKHTQAELWWGFFLLCYLLGCCSLGRSWVNGEFTRSSRSGFKSWKIRRDDDPSGFQRYLIGMVVINAVFSIFLVILGVAIFLW